MKEGLSDDALESFSCRRLPSTADAIQYDHSSGHQESLARVRYFDGLEQLEAFAPQHHVGGKIAILGEIALARLTPMTETEVAFALRSSEVFINMIKTHLTEFNCF